MNRFLDAIRIIYLELNNEFLATQPYNGPKTRFETVLKITEQLNSLGVDKLVNKFRVIIDETNNTPEVIDNNIMMARIVWDCGVSGEYQYIDLEFGRVEMKWEFDFKPVSFIPKHKF